MLLVMMIIFRLRRVTQPRMENLLSVLDVESESLTSFTFAPWRRNGIRPVSSVRSVELSWKMKLHALNERDTSTVEMII